MTVVVEVSQVHVRKVTAHVGAILNAIRQKLLPVVILIQNMGITCNKTLQTFNSAKNVTPADLQHSRQRCVHVTSTLSDVSQQGTCTHVGTYNKEQRLRAADGDVEALRVAEKSNTALNVHRHIAFIRAHL